MEWTRCFFHFGEFARTTRFDRLHGFVIGSIREPCSQYLSLWSFGSTGGGTFRKKLKKTDLYGVSAPYFNTTSDKKRFLAWMKHPMVVGRVGNRVKESYGESFLDTVDCWVFVEDFQNSLLNCLQRYADQGGFVDWQAPTVAALLEQRSKTDEKGHHKLAANKNDPRENKNDPLGDPRSSHHGKCEDMFDAETAKQVEKITEPFVYDIFGYEGCCKPGTNFYPRGDNNIPINFGGEANFTTNSPKPFHSNSFENVSPFNDTDSTPTVSNPHNTWLSSPPTTQSYNDRTIDAVVAVATITGILLLTFYRLLRII